jgi:hypothetical protein
MLKYIFKYSSKRAVSLFTSPSSTTSSSNFYFRRLNYILKHSSHTTLEQNSRLVCCVIQGWTIIISLLQGQNFHCNKISLPTNAMLRPHFLLSYNRKSPLVPQAQVSNFIYLTNSSSTCNVLNCWFCPGSGKPWLRLQIIYIYICCVLPSVVDILVFWDVHTICPSSN